MTVYGALSRTIASGFGEYQYQSRETTLDERIRVTRQL